MLFRSQKFNNDFKVQIEGLGYADGIFFPQPNPVIEGPATRVMSLRDGTKKMSKSDPSDLSRINLTDDTDTVARKIQKAKTDPNPLPTEEKGLEGRPEAENLVGIYAALTEQPVSAVLKNFGGKQFSDFKKSLTEVATEKIGKIGAETKRLSADSSYIDGVLADGAARARQIAKPIMNEVKDLLGLLRS